MQRQSLKFNSINNCRLRRIDQNRVGANQFDSSTQSGVNLVMQLVLLQNLEKTRTSAYRVKSVFRRATFVDGTALGT